MTAEELAAERTRYLRAFGAAFVLGVIIRVLSERLDIYGGGQPPTGLILTGLTVGIAAFAAAVWFSFRSFKFARALGSGTTGAAAFGVFSFVPLLNFVSVLILLARYRKATKA